MEINLEKATILDATVQTDLVKSSILEQCLYVLRTMSEFRNLTYRVTRTRNDVEMVVVYREGILGIFGPPIDPITLVLDPQGKCLLSIPFKPVQRVSIVNPESGYIERTSLLALFGMIAGNGYLFCPGLPEKFLTGKACGKFVVLHKVPFKRYQSSRCPVYYQAQVVQEDTKSSLCALCPRCLQAAKWIQSLPMIAPNGTGKTSTPTLIDSPQLDQKNTIICTSIDNTVNTQEINNTSPSLSASRLFSPENLNNRSVTSVPNGQDYLNIHFMNMTVNTGASTMDLNGNTQTTDFLKGNHAISGQSACVEDNNTSVNTKIQEKISFLRKLLQERSRKKLGFTELNTEAKDGKTLNKEVTRKLTNKITKVKQRNRNICHHCKKKFSTEANLMNHFQRHEALTGSGYKQIRKQNLLRNHTSSSNLPKMLVRRTMLSSVLHGKKPVRLSETSLRLLLKYFDNIISSHSRDTFVQHQGHNAVDCKTDISENKKLVGHKSSKLFHNEQVNERRRKFHNEQMEHGVENNSFIYKEHSENEAGRKLFHKEQTENEAEKRSLFQKEQTENEAEKRSLFQKEQTENEAEKRSLFQKEQTENEAEKRYKLLHKKQTEHKAEKRYGVKRTLSDLSPMQTLLEAAAIAGSYTISSSSHIVIEKHNEAAIVSSKSQSPPIESELIEASGPEKKPRKSTIVTAKKDHSCNGTYENMCNATAVSKRSTASENNFQLGNLNLLSTVSIETAMKETPTNSHNSDYISCSIPNTLCPKVKTRAAVLKTCDSKNNPLQLFNNALENEFLINGVRGKEPGTSVNSSADHKLDPLMLTRAMQEAMSAHSSPSQKQDQPQSNSATPYSLRNPATLGNKQSISASLGRPNKIEMNSNIDHGAIDLSKPKSQTTANIPLFVQKSPNVTASSDLPQKLAQISTGKSSHEDLVRMRTVAEFLGHKKSHLGCAVVSNKQIDSDLQAHLSASALNYKTDREGKRSPQVQAFTSASSVVKQEKVVKSEDGLIVQPADEIQCGYKWTGSGGLVKERTQMVRELVPSHIMANFLSKPYTLVSVTEPTSTSLPDTSKTPLASPKLVMSSKSGQTAVNNSQNTSKTQCALNLTKSKHAEVSALNNVTSRNSSPQVSTFSSVVSNYTTSTPVTIILQPVTKMYDIGHSDVVSNRSRNSKAPNKRITVDSSMHSSPRSDYIKTEPVDSNNTEQNVAVKYTLPIKVEKWDVDTDDSATSEDCSSSPRRLVVSISPETISNKGKGKTLNLDHAISRTADLASKNIPVK